MGRKSGRTVYKVGIVKQEHFLSCSPCGIVYAREVRGSVFLNKKVLKWNREKIRRLGRFRNLHERFLIRFHNATQKQTLWRNFKLEIRHEDARQRESEPPSSRKFLLLPPHSEGKELLARMKQHEGTEAIWLQERTIRAWVDAEAHPEYGRETPSSKQFWCERGKPYRSAGLCPQNQ